MSTSDNRCPMLEAWEEEIKELWNSETSCTGNSVHTRTDFEHVWIVTTGERKYVAKTLYKEFAVEEFLFLQRLAPHPLINVLIGAVPAPQMFYWVLQVEYCEHGSLYCFLEKEPHPDDVSTNLLLWLQQLLQALVHIHEHKVVHCDIKSPNIFMKNPKHLVIGDFGLAYDANIHGKCEEGSGGTEEYLPPEQWDFRQGNAPPSTDRSDVWSLGCVVQELMYGLRKGNDAGKSFVDLVRAGLLDKPDDVPVKPEHARCRKIATAVRALALRMRPDRPRAQVLLNKLDSLIAAEERPVKRQKTVSFAC